MRWCWTIWLAVPFLHDAHSASTDPERGNRATARRPFSLSARAPNSQKVRDDAPDAPPRSIDSAEVATPYKTCTMKTDFQVCLATTIMHVRLR